MAEAARWATPRPWLSAHRVTMHNPAHYDLIMLQLPGLLLSLWGRLLGACHHHQLAGENLGVRQAGPYGHVVRAAAKFPTFTKRSRFLKMSGRAVLLSVLLLSDPALQPIQWQRNVWPGFCLGGGGVLGFPRSSTSLLGNQPINPHQIIQGCSRILNQHSKQIPSQRSDESFLLRHRKERSRCRLFHQAGSQTGERRRLPQ